jgi:phosphoribosylglycinamide formyltransferase-1
MSDRRRVGILISGRGSNMVALVDAMRSGTVAAEPALVLSNVPGAPGLRLAADRGVPTAVIDHKAIKPRGEHEARVVETLHEHRIDLLCLAGYMRLLSPLLIEAYRDRILNIHPSLLPAFPGLNAQRQALDYGAKITGCTVHLVDEECDHGPIVLQAAVPITDDDDEETLSARILEQEHRTYSRALALLVADRLVVEGRRVLPVSRSSS